MIEIDVRENADVMSIGRSQAFHCAFNAVVCGIDLVAFRDVMLSSSETK